MKLEDCWGQKVKLIDINNNEWIEIVVGFTVKNNNSEEKDSIDLKIDYNIYEIYEDEMKLIKIID